MFLYSHTLDYNVDKLLTLLSFLWESFGILVCILLFDRKAEKENMMSRVFIICTCVIQVFLVLIFKNFYISNLDLKLLNFYNDYIFLFIYLLVINIITFFIYGLDKLKAILDKNRIPIINLLLLAFCGGSIGALSSMYLFRHKTTKDYFTVGIPIMILMQFTILFYLFIIN